MATSSIISRNTYRPKGQPRVIHERGRAPTALEIGRSDGKEFRYLNDKYSSKITHWYPCAKKRSHEKGEVFIFRLLPALKMVMVNASTDQEERIATFVSGREPDGMLNSDVIRRVGVIEHFGPGQLVSFIPSLPYVPENQEYPLYSSPSDNPYQLLRKALWEQGNRLKKEWLPLIMVPKEIDEYRVQMKMKSQRRSEMLLPMPKERFFAYGLIYRGHNPETGKDFLFDGTAYGALAGHGLQIISFNTQVFKALQRAYRQRMESDDDTENDRFIFPDPADADAGTLNYIWNPKFPNPVTGDEKDTIGYDATVSRKYFTNPEQGRKINLELDQEFLDQYYQSWEPWSEILRGTYGVELVQLLARFFPELKGPCKMAWQSHKSLMEAWEKAFHDGPDEFDFYDLLHRKYAEDRDQEESEEQKETGNSTGKATSPHRESSRLSREPSVTRDATEERRDDFVQEAVRESIPHEDNLARGGRAATAMTQRGKTRPRVLGTRQPASERNVGAVEDMKVTSADFSIPPEQDRRQETVETGQEQNQF